MNSRSRRRYTREAIRGLRRAAIGPQRIGLLGQDFDVAYEARLTVEFPDFPFLVDIARGKQCVLDIGANLGIARLLMARQLGPEGIIYAIDASEAACFIAQENVELNKLTSRIIVVNALVGEESGCTRRLFFNTYRWSPMASTTSREMSHENWMTKVSISVDDLVGHLNLQPDFVKIDVEGAELETLKGMSQVLRVNRPAIVIEIHDSESEDFSERIRTVLSLFSAYDYEGFKLGGQTLDVDEVTSEQPHVLFRPRA